MKISHFFIFLYALCQAFFIMLLLIYLFGNNSDSFSDSLKYPLIISGLITFGLLPILWKYERQIFEEVVAYFIG